jgi:uncharacterized protein with HEPN domain
MKKDDRLYVIHILECIDRIQRYTVDGGEAFMEDTKTQDAVMRNLQTLAESTQRLSDDLRQRYPPTSSGATLRLFAMSPFTNTWASI